VKGRETRFGVRGRVVWFAVRLTLTLWVVGGALGCVAGEVPPGLPPTWTVSLLQSSGSEDGTQPEVSSCRADGSHCARLTVGRTFTADGVVATGSGTEASLKLGPATIVALVDQVELGLVDGAPRRLELRRGRIVLAQAEASAPRHGAAPPTTLEVGLADARFTVDPATPTTVAVHAHDSDRAALTVHRGKITLRPAVGESLVLHAGQTLRLVAGHRPDLRSATTGKLTPVERRGVELRTDGKAAAVEPRGFGTMTARVPRGREVIAGVRLVSHHVRVTIRDGFARTEVEEVFYNETERVLEGRYEFALPPDASISRVALWVGDELVEGEVVERERALRVFKGIVDAPVLPRDPALLEWISGGRFSLTIFPIPAKQGRRVLLSYDQALPRRAGVTRYVYPMSLGAERATQIDELSFELRASDSRSALGQVQVPHYPAEVKGGQDLAVSFRARSFVPTADMVVSFATEPRPGAQLSAHVPGWGKANEGLADIELAGGERGFFALRLVAAVPADALRSAFVRRDRAIIVDTSHSQSAETLAGERAMAAELLRQLDPDERFVVLACDSACETYPEEGLAPATADALRPAVEWLAQRTAGGSSDLAGALLAAARRLESNGAGQIVYLGDGSPSSGELSAARIADRVRGLLRARRVDLRLLGAGRSLDEVVLRGLALHLGASYERVANGDPLGPRVVQIAQGLRQPLVVGATLDLPASFVDVHPKTLPNLRLGQELLVVGKLAGMEPGEVTLRGRLAGQPYASSQPVTWTGQARRHNPLVPRLWALARLAELQATGDGAAARREIVDLSQQYSVLSRHTSFLVLENDAMYREFGIARRRGGRSPGASEVPGSWGAGLGSTASAGGLAGQLADLDVATIGALRRRGAASGSSGRGGFAGGGFSGGLLDSAGTVASVGGGAVGRPASAGKSQKVAGVRGSAMVGGAGVGGGVVSNATSVVARMRGRFRRCYQLGLRQNPELQGTVTLTAKVGPNGEVLGVGGGSAALSTIVPCLKAVVSAGGFSPPEGGGAVIAIPITFVRHDGSTSSTASSSNPSQRDWSVPPLLPRPAPRPSWSGPSFELYAHHRAGTEVWRETGEPLVARLRAALAQDGKSRRNHASLVRALVRHGRFKPALTAARRFVALDPDLDLAQELLAQTAVVNGDRELALGAIDTLAETHPRSSAAHLRAARAFEASGDERRACAHWRSAHELRPQSDRAIFEALRCRARVLGDRSSALTEAQRVSDPGKLVTSLIPKLQQDAAPAYQPGTTRPGLFEAKLTCAAAIGSCPTVAVVTPGGQVLSPWTPAAARSSAQSVAFAAVPSGTYRTLVVGGSPSARAELVLRTGSSRRTFAARGGATRTVAETRVEVQHW